MKARFGLVRTARPPSGAKAGNLEARHLRSRDRSAALNLIPFVLLALAGVGPAAAEDLLRVTCRGLFQLSVTEPALECAESDVLTDPEGGMLSAFSAAEADLGGARLAAGAAGGAIRDVGYIGREASALMLQDFRIGGDWQGAMPLTITLELRYGFGGYGEGRMRAALWSSLDGAVRRENYAGIRIRHTGFGGALLSDDNSRGNHSLPQPGPYPSRSDLRLRVVQHVPRERPDIVVRADLYMLATPSLGSLDTTTSALATAQAELVLSAPCPASAHSQYGVLAIAEPTQNTEVQRDDTDWRCGPTVPVP